MLGGANAQTVHFANVCFVYVKRLFSEGRVHLADGGDLETTRALPRQAACGVIGPAGLPPQPSSGLPRQPQAATQNPNTVHKDPGRDLKTLTFNSIR